MIFRINNGRHMQVSQTKPDGPVKVETYAPAGDKMNKEQSIEISPGDFVMMVNWYRYQKENGNENLNF